MMVAGVCDLLPHPDAAGLPQGFTTASVSLSGLIKTQPSLMLFVPFSLPVRNWIREVGDLYQTGQTGGGTRVCAPWPLTAHTHACKHPHTRVV